MDLALVKLAISAQIPLALGYFASPIIFRLRMPFDHVGIPPHEDVLAGSVLFASMGLVFLALALANIWTSSMEQPAESAIKSNLPWVACLGMLIGAWIFWIALQMNALAITAMIVFVIMAIGIPWIYRVCFQLDVKM